MASQQLWVTDSLGGYLSNNRLSRQLRYAAQPLMVFRDHCDIEDAAGKNRGDIVYFDKISNISTAGGTLSETATIPRRNFTVKKGSLQLVEYGNKKVAVRRLLLEALKLLRLIR
ncbi:MAG: hypothetical protein DRH51_05875 [Candidatus Coatesbacteria bacterium]|nr:MAG: hypothetical protein DRH51_05875 [Candidatus Coatesbacteria bacterium]